MRLKDYKYEHLMTSHYNVWNKINLKLMGWVNAISSKFVFINRRSWQ